MYVKDLLDLLKLSPEAEVKSMSLLVKDFVEEGTINFGYGKGEEPYQKVSDSACITLGEGNCVATHLAIDNPPRNMLYRKKEHQKILSTGRLTWNLPQSTSEIQIIGFGDKT